MENNTQNILISRRKEFINDIDKKLFNKLVIFDISGFGNINHYYGYHFGEKILELVLLTQLSQIKPNCFLV